MVALCLLLDQESCGCWQDLGKDNRESGDRLG